MHTCSPLLALIAPALWLGWPSQALVYSLAHSPSDVFEVSPTALVVAFVKDSVSTSSWHRRPISRAHTGPWNKNRGSTTAGTAKTVYLVKIPFSKCPPYSCNSYFPLFLFVSAAEIWDYPTHACCCACKDRKALEKEMAVNSARLPHAIITGDNKHDSNRCSNCRGYDDYSKKKMAYVGDASIMLVWRLCE